MNYHSFWNDGAVCFPEIQGQEFTPPVLSTRWVKGDMILGNAHAGCRGAGICKISEHGQRSILSICGCESIPVFLIRVNNNCIQLIVDKQVFNFAQRMKHFHNNKAAVHKAIPLPHRMREILGYKAKISVDVQDVELHAGQYCYYFFMYVSHIKK